MIKQDIKIPKPMNLPTETRIKYFLSFGMAQAENSLICGGVGDIIEAELPAAKIGFVGS